MALAATLVVSFAVPAVSFAEENEGKNRPDTESLRKNILERVRQILPFKARFAPSTRPRPELADDSDMKTGKFACSRLPQLFGEVQVKTAERRSELLKSQEEARRKVQRRKEAVREKVSERRDEWSDNFKERFAALERRAATTEQRAAVAAFRASVESALAARRSAIDAATAAFASSSAASAGEREARIAEITETYRVSVASAAEKAKNDCAADPRNVVAVREAYMASVKAAKERFDADRKVLEELKTDVTDAAKTYKDALRKADADFKAAVEAASKTLKAAFPGA